MTKEFNQSMELVALDILETAAFLFPDSCDDSELISGFEIETAVALSFNGPETGKMKLFASSGFKTSLAANMLGVDEDDQRAKEKGLDALKEILNMVVGSWVTKVWDDDLVIQLGIPEEMLETEIRGAKLIENGVWIDVEGHLVCFTYEMES